MRKRLFLMGWLLVACLGWLNFACAAGDGTAENPYEISTVEEYNLFASNAYSHAVLTADLDFSEKSISTVAAYSGTFDGQNHTLKNISLSPENDCALFQQISSGATVKNVKLENVTITGGQSAAGLAYQNFGTISGCSAEAVKITGNQNAGIFACTNETGGVIENCTADSASSVGAGSNTSTSAICSAGGMAAINNGTIAHCTNEASVTVAASGWLYAGGIAGRVTVQQSSPASFFRCVNSGKIWANDQQPDTGSAAAGGIVGGYYTSGDSAAFNIEECWNTGAVTAYSHAGGIAGNRSSSASTYINNCWNGGTVTTTTIERENAGAGGISGAYGSAVVKNSLNVGKVIVETYGAPLIIKTYKTSPTATELINCYALHDCVTKSDGTAIEYERYYGYKNEQGSTAAELADGTVCAALNAGQEKTVWIRGGTHPVLKTESAGKQLERIEITLPPNKREYAAGDPFDDSGMVVTAIYSDGTSGTDVEFEVVNGENLTTDQTTVTIRYTENNITKETTQAITVNIPTYTVTVTNGTGSGEYTEGASVTITANAPQDGYYFTGWTTEDGLTFENKDSASTVFTMPEKAVSVMATYARIELTSIEITTPPAKTSYLAGDPFDESGMVVTAHYNNGMSKDVTGYTAANGKKLTAGQNTVTISYTEGNITKETTQPITVSKPTYAVTVENGTGGGTYAAGISVTITANAPQDGYYFTGWTTEDGLTFENKDSATTVFTMPAKAVSVAATYARIKLTSIEITTPPAKTSYLAGDPFDESGMVVTAHYNNGMSKDVTGYTAANGKKLTAGQNTVTITYTENNITQTTTQPIAVNLPTYIVTYTPGAYGEGGQTTAVKTHGISLALSGALYTRRGFHQTGWEDEANTRYSLGAFYTADAPLTLHPVWTNASYAIHLDADGGAILEECPTSYTYGTGAELPQNIVKEGFRFLGWYDEEQAVSAIGPDETGEKSFTAHWMRQHSIIFDANSGEGTMDSVTLDEGESVMLPACLFTPPQGQRFHGWLMDGKIYQSGERVTVLDSIAVKALWEIIPQTVYEGGIAMDEAEMLDAVLTEEEKASGKSAVVLLVMKDISDQVPPEDKALLEKELSGGKAAVYLDITLFKQVEGENAQPVSNPGGKIKLNFEVPLNALNYRKDIHRTYFILCAHEGKVQRIPAKFDPETRMISFEASAFSTYLLAYEDSEPALIPQTGDSSAVALWAALALLSLAALTCFMKKSKINGVKPE